MGEPGGTFSIELDSWPSDEAEPATFYLGGDETLTTDEPGRADEGAVDAFRFDPEAGAATLFGGTGDYPLLDPVWTTPTGPGSTPARSCPT